MASLFMSCMSCQVRYFLNPISGSRSDRQKKTEVSRLITFACCRNLVPTLELGRYRLTSKDVTGLVVDFLPSRAVEPSINAAPYQQTITLKIERNLSLEDPSSPIETPIVSS